MDRTVKTRLNIRKWLKKRKGPDFVDELKKYKNEREERQKGITSLHKKIFDLVAEHLGVDVRMVVEGFIDSQQHVDILRSFTAKHGIVHVFFAFGVFPKAPATSGRYDSLEMWQARCSSKRIVLSYNEPSDIAHECALIYRVDNNAPITLANYEDVIFSRYIQAPQPSRTIITTFVKDVNEFLQSDALDAVQDEIAAVQKIPHISLCNDFQRIVSNVRKLDDIIHERPVFEIDQKFFEKFLIRDVVIKETALWPERQNERVELECIFRRWMNQIKRILAEGQQIYRELPMLGPLSELHHWKTVLMQYTFVEQAIKERQFTSVLQCLTLYKSPLIKDWKIIKDDLSNSLIKTQDINLFLESLTKFFNGLHVLSPHNVTNQFTGLLKLVRNVCDRSQHYHSATKVCEFVGIFVTQMVVLCKHYIEEEGSVWTQERSKVCERINVTKNLLDTLEEKYKSVGEWDCSIQHTFIEKIHLMKQIDLIEQIFSVMETFSVLDRKKMSSMEGFAKQMKENFEIIASNPLSPFDGKNKVFPDEFRKFMEETAAVELEICKMMTRLVENCETVSAKLLIVKQYSKFNLKSLRIDYQYAEIAKKLEDDILKIHKVYMETFVSKETRKNLSASKSIRMLRGLLKNVEDPIEVFQSHNSLKVNQALNDSLQMLDWLKAIFEKLEKKIVKRWKSETAKKVDEALKEPVFARHPTTLGYIVNFKQELYNAMCESDKMRKMMVEEPEFSKIILASKKTLLRQRDALLECAKKDKQIRRTIPQILLNMMTPRLQAVDRLFKKGQTIVFWMSNMLPFYIDELNGMLNDTMNFVLQIRDRTLIVEDYLDEISDVILAKVPEEPVSLDVLKGKQLDHLKEMEKIIMAKSAYMETVVIEIIEKLCNEVDFPMHDNSNQPQFMLKTEDDVYEDDSALPVDKYDWIDFADLPRKVTVPTHLSENELLYKNFDEIDFTLEHFHKCCMDVFNYFYNEFLSTLGEIFINTIDYLKQHFIKERGMDSSITPVIATRIVLKIPNFSLEPPLDEINENCQLILNQLKNFFQRITSWGFQAKTQERKKIPPNKWEKIYSKSVFNFVLEKIDMSQTVDEFKVFLKEDVEKVIKELKSNYEYLWCKNKEEINTEITYSDPSTIKIQEILESHTNTIKDAENKKNVTFICIPLIISVQDAMEVILEEMEVWRNDLCERLLKELKKKVYRRLKIINDHTKSLKGSVNTIEKIPNIFKSLQSISDDRIETERNYVQATEILSHITNNSDHSSIEMKFYIDAVYDMGKRNRDLMDLEGQMRMQLMEIYEPLLNDLMVKEENFVIEWKKFEEDFETAGPLVDDISAKTASNRFFTFSMRYDEIFQLFETIQNGKKIFGLPPLMDSDKILDRKKQLENLMKLYGLYTAIVNLEQAYKSTKWSELDVNQMAEDFKEIQNKFTRLRTDLHQWKAYDEIKKILNYMNEIFPLIELLTNSAVKEHHWSSLNTCLNTNLDIESLEFTLGTVLDTEIRELKDQVEDIGIAALKEKEIEEKLRQIEEMWSNMQFPVAPYKGRGNFLLKGAETQDLLVQLDDTLLILNSLAANRYNEIFMSRTQNWIEKLSKTSGNLDMWLQVQNLWLYLEAIFDSSDLSRQLPQEAKLFANVDVNFSRIVNRALAIDKLVECCTHHDLQNCFPIIMEELEKCLKSLSSYLERKRKLFPRFYFISDAILIEILGQSSNPENIQPFLLSLFDSIAKVDFREDTSGTIVAMVSSNEERVFLTKTILCTDSVESWLGELLKEMQLSIKSNAYEMAKNVLEPKYDFISEFSRYAGQMGIIGLQVFWTITSERALRKSKKDSMAMKQTNMVFLSLLNRLIDQTALELSPLDRTKYEAMITIHLHQRDIFNQLYVTRVSSSQNFEWQKQQRFYHIDETEEIVSRITNVSFAYQNEYLGVTDRLVITPLTDRCYITLAQAILLNMGGAPAGPAGTGKTETTKDMGKSLGKYVVVFNCSDQMDFRGLGQIFKGLSESGSWGCFDEFNRIELSVLSVAAQQISILLKARKEQSPVFTFSDGDSLKLNMECGVFITMNPGYAGRQELPENLKVMFRTVAMMVPDRQIIIRVKLASCGFKENIVLARKFFTLYKLCENQLSQQIHYDFGLRNILSVLRTLGVQKRSNAGGNEQATLMKVIRDMNLSKLIAEDKPIFLSLVRDIFQKVRLVKFQYSELQDSIAKYADQEKLINTSEWNLKVQQLYETCLVRHGIMVMGATFTGKTTAMKVLVEHFRNLGQKYHIMRMNPKALTTSQMFGKLDVATNEWTDGVFSVLFRKICKTTENDYYWLIMDGPVDTIWIENLNSVLDDNRTLTLANGDRIIMSPNSKLIFEAENVDNASPATVSRLGMIYFSPSVLEWKDVLRSWEARNPKNIVTPAKECLDRGFSVLLDLVTIKLSPKMQITHNAYIKQCTDIIDSLLKNMGQPLEPENIRKLTLYSMIWSLGALLDTNDRKEFQIFIRIHLKELPWPKTEVNQSIFEFFVNSLGEWDHWSSNIPEVIQSPTEEFRFFEMIIPNVESLQMTHLLKHLWKQKRPVLLIGEQGSGKTKTVEQFMGKFRAEENLSKIINFSSLTTPAMFQKIIQGSVDKRTGALYGPPGHKKLTLFIDDLNMPVINEWGDQTTNEIVRQLMEFEGFYNLEKPGIFTGIQDLLFLAAMINPGGGQNDIPNRMKRHFAIFTYTMPSEDSIDRIFNEIAKGYFKPEVFCKDILDFYPKLVTMTRKLWQVTKNSLLPSPAKFHYIFNLRDFSRIWQGILQIKPAEYKTIPDILDLWLHETRRVIADRCISSSDRQWFIGAQLKLCNEELKDFSEDTFKETFFVNFLRDIPEPNDDDSQEYDDLTPLEAPKVYEAVKNINDCKVKVEHFLSEYNETVRGGKLNLVMFKDALAHLIIISRILNMERGNALLVGIGGFGKRSLTRLASFIAGYTFHQITLTTGYNTSNLLEDIRAAYAEAGLGKGVTFLFTEANVVDETFLDHINNLLTSGEIPNLFTKEEYFEIMNELSAQLMRKDPKRVYIHEEKMELFRTAARKNFHLVLTFSPIGTTLRGLMIKFPGLLSGCTIDWFQDWPETARIAVAKHILEDFDIVCDATTKERLIKSISDIHGCIQSISEEYFERFRRKIYIIPKTFRNFLEKYRELYVRKKEHIKEMSQRMTGGIQKLLDAAESIEVLKVELLEKEKHIDLATVETDRALKLVEESTRTAEEVRNRVMDKKTNAASLVKEIEKDKEMVEKKLEEARPALAEAKEALKTIKATDIAAVRKLTVPPHLVKMIMDCVLIYLNEKLEKVSVDTEKNFLNSSYKRSLKVMTGTKFLPKLVDFNTDVINAETMDLLVPYLRLTNYNFENAKLACGNVAGLLKWTQAMVNHYDINKDVLPLKETLTHQLAKYQVASEDLEKAEVMLETTENELAEIQKELDITMAKKETVLEEATKCKNKLDNASQLIAGLGDEKISWSKRIEECESEIQMLVGDIFYMSGFITYAGAFNEEFRTIIKMLLCDKLSENQLPCQESQNLVDFFINRSVVTEWLLYGLPHDDFSTQNAIFTTQSGKFPLLIDPQSQGVGWIEKMEEKNNLIVLQQNMKNFQMKIENAIEEGSVVLLKDVEENLDPCLVNILEKNLIKTGTTLKIVIVDKEILWNDNFRLYITTKMENPLYSPEVSSAVTVVDFTVTLTGLENQLLSRVICSEQAELEQQRIKLVEGITNNMQMQEKLEKDLLEKLASIKGSILDDVDLLQMLNNSRATANDIRKKLETSSKTENEINNAREVYRPIAKRGSILYFILSTLPKMCYMYRTSLSQFLIKVDKSLAQGNQRGNLEQRIASIINKLTINVFRYQSRGLYEQHRYTFAILMTLQIDVQLGKIQRSEYDYFLKGGTSVDATTARKKPFKWLPDHIWLNISELVKLDRFSTLLNNMLIREKPWQNWYTRSNPENTLTPFEQASGKKLSQFHRLLLIRAFCTDRILSQSRKYISESLGDEYLQPIIIDFAELVEESSPVTPLICLLSMGADPSVDIADIAKKHEVTLQSISMGQGQEVLARTLYEGVMSNSGGWLLIQNSHLDLDYMSELASELAVREKSQEYPKNTRIWITSAPVDKYPINLLQMAIKYTNDPPSGVKAGLKRTYGNLTQDVLDYSNSKYYISLIYVVSFMHSIIQERRKYGPIGWNIPYEFNSSDWLSSCLFIQNHLFDVQINKSSIDWSAIRYMLSEVHYGGRVTDKMDLRLLSEFTKMWFDNSIAADDFYLRPGFEVIKLKTKDEYLKYFSEMDQVEGPETCGLHPNIETNYNIMVVQDILDTVLAVQPKGATASDGETRESQVARKAHELLQKLPEPFDVHKVEGKLKEMGTLDPMVIFLRQEIDAMQNLLTVVRKNLRDLFLAIDGMIVMSPALQDAMDSLYDGTIPKIWEKSSWPTTDKLGFWFTNLLKRTEFLHSWCFNGRPNIFWFGGLFNPNGFLTAIRQEGVKRHPEWPLDTVVLDNIVLPMMVSECKKVAREGIFMYGLVLEGAGWDRKNSALCELQTNVIHTQMPVIHVFAVPVRSNDNESYECPVYRTPKRQQCVTTLRLKTLKRPREKDTNWILRGTALITE